ncbi:ABC transporter G family member 1 [Spatholobus suberectus]|nr:ABC transporter G family member 1 [Spatholobus suberectus]
MMSSILCHSLRTKASYDETYDGSRQGQTNLELGANLAKCSEERNKGETVPNVEAEQGDSIKLTEVSGSVQGENQDITVTWENLWVTVPSGKEKKANFAGSYRLCPARKDSGHNGPFRMWKIYTS